MSWFSSVRSGGEVGVEDEQLSDNAVAVNSEKEVPMRPKRPVVVHVFMIPTPKPEYVAAAEVHGAARDRKDSIEPRHGLSSPSVLRATVGSVPIAVRRGVGRHDGIGSGRWCKAPGYGQIPRPPANVTPPGDCRASLLE